MIKQYMCSNFLAEQILNDVAPASPRLEHRIGIAEGAGTTKKKSKSIKRDIQETMRFDQGSTGYKNWLAKTATMDDIYQHISPPSTSNFNLTRNAETTGSRRQDKPISEDYEEGDVTGFALQQPVQVDPLKLNFLHGFVPQDAYPFELAKDPISVSHQPIAGNKAVIPEFHGSGLEFYPPHYQSDYPIYHHSEHHFNTNSVQHSSDDSKDSSTNSNNNKNKGFFGKLIGKIKNKGQQWFGEDHVDDHHSQSYDKGSGKEMGLKDLFDIVLTTLAFLAFGMFILQVLMCVTMTTSNTNSNMMMMPIDNVDIEVVEEEVKRSKRFAAPSAVVQMNELSKRVLQSIEALLRVDKDNAKCLHRIICENNQYFRNRMDGQKIWMPIWNLGLSWLSSKLHQSRNSAATIFEGLKASALGLGNAQCKLLYPCNGQ